MRPFLSLAFLLPALLSACASHAPSRTTPTAPDITLLSFNHEIWSPRMSAAQVLFQDGAQSIPCPGGTLWLFGDTFTGLPTPADSATPPAKELKPNYTGMLGATIAFLPSSPPASPSLAFSYFTTPDRKAANPFSLLPNESSDLYRMWPLGGISLAGKTYIYYAMIQKTEGLAPWNFKGIGGGLASSPTPLGSYTRIMPDNDWRFPIEPFQVLRSGDFLYLFQIRGEPPLKGASLARVCAADIERPAAYEWFSGLDSSGAPAWSHTASESAVILPEAAGQISIAWNETLGCWLAATSSDFFHPREIQLRTAHHLWGPWSAPTRLPVQDKPGKATDLIYCTCIHSELSSPDGSEVALTFCRMLKGDWELSNPELVRVRVRPSRHSALPR